jgi:hypothetical protein
MGHIKSIHHGSHKEWGIENNEQHMVMEVLYLDKLLPGWIHRSHLESESPTLASPGAYVVSLDLKFPGRGWFWRGLFTRASECKYRQILGMSHAGL